MGLIAALVLSTAAHAATQADVLHGLTGAWHSVSGYTEGVQGSSCWTNQSLLVSATSDRDALVTFSIQCSTGLQTQFQGLNFNLWAGTQPNGFNTVTSSWVLEASGNTIGIKRVQDTTWGFGSMMTHQYQTVTLVGGGDTIDFTYSEQQQGWSNGAYHLKMVRDQVR